MAHKLYDLSPGSFTLKFCCTGLCKWKCCFQESLHHITIDMPLSKKPKPMPKFTIMDKGQSDEGDRSSVYSRRFLCCCCFLVFYCHAHKTEYVCFNQTGDISTLNGSSLKLIDKFTYLGSSVSSIETDIDTRLTKAWTAINSLSVIWKSDLTDKMKRSFFQAVIVSILLYGCTTWTLTKRQEKKLDGNYTRMLRAILKRSWRQHSTKKPLYGHLQLITKNIQIRRIRHAGHCWRSRDELINDTLI